MSTSPDDQGLGEQTDALYDRHGKPLEKEHWGEFLAVTADGRTLLADDYLDAAVRGEEAFGPDPVFLFKVGEVAVGYIG